MTLYANVYVRKKYSVCVKMLRRKFKSKNYTKKIIKVYVDLFRTIIIFEQTLLEQQ